MQRDRAPRISICNKRTVLEGQQAKDFFFYASGTWLSPLRSQSLELSLKCTLGLVGGQLVL